MTYRPPIDDILFLLREVIDAEAILARPEFAHVDTDSLESVVRQAGRIAAEIVAPINAAADRVGATFENGVVRLPPGFREAYEAFCAGGWTGLALPERYGGHAMPEIAQAALSETINGASLAFSMLTVTGRAAARVLLAHADPEMQALWVPKFVSGEWAGTIVMTEPHAGSDIGQARTKAVPQADGSYALTGTKIFISFGDHDATPQIGHIVLARIEDASEGVRGLSLFLVPRAMIEADGTLGPRNAIAASRIEEKMGIHGSPTCEMRLDGATGYLLGAPERGIQNMFTMINTMRLEVALEGVGIAGAALDKAARYASERIQGGSGGTATAIVEHADIRRSLLRMKALTGGARALCYETAALLDRGRSDEAGFLLPICKAVASDIAVEVASLAIQVHGGHGYIAEHGVEQLMRDARITPIYEGTNGIQAIDLLLRKIGRDDAKTLALLCARIEADLDGGEIGDAVSAGLAEWRRVSALLLDRLREDANSGLSGATPYLRLAGTVLMGWMWLRMAAAAKDDAYGAEIRVLARFYAADIMAEIDGLARRALMPADILYTLDSETIARV